MAKLLSDVSRLCGGDVSGGSARQEWPLGQNCAAQEKAGSVVAKALSDAIGVWFVDLGGKWKVAGSQARTQPAPDEHRQRVAARERSRWAGGAAGRALQLEFPGTKTSRHDVLEREKGRPRDGQPL